MSQFFLKETGTSLPDIETITGNSGGAVGPDGSFNINLLGSNGILIAGNPGTNTLTASIQNGSTANATTVGATTADIITVALSSLANTTYTFDIRIAGIDTATPSGVGYNIFGTIRTTGAAASLVGTPDKITNEDAAATAADANLIVSGNNAIIRVTGVAGLTINWGAFAVYVTSQ